MLTFILVLGVSATIAAIWHLRPQVYDTVRLSNRLVVFEGLPHPMYEEATFEKELKSQQTIQISGFPFYLEPLDMKVEDLKALRDLLGNRNTYQAYSGEKKCGGFHPDYAVEWTFEGRVYRCLICFGCFEVRFIDPKGNERSYDLRQDRDGRTRKSGLSDLLKTYRNHRPPHERFGLFLL
ncbi:hypothetical protein EP7_001672 [Isosphaeraceae bacterium EP7]